MDPLTLLAGGVLASTLLIHPQLGATPPWDIAQGFGYLAFALLLYSFLDTGLGPRQRLHRHFGYLLSALLVIHCGWLLLSDPQVLYYLSWDAPAYMLAGLAAILLLALLVLTALPIGKGRVHQSQAEFRYWHQLLGITIVLLSLWHILGSGFYITGYEATVLAIVTALVLLLQLFRVRVTTAADYRTLVPVLALCAGFLALKWLGNA